MIFPFQSFKKEARGSCYYLIRVFLIGFLLFASIQLHSQVEYNTGAWAMGFSQVRIHDRISIHLEAQYRDHGIFNEAEQILLRGGLNYHLGAQAIASAGYGRITGYTADGEFMNTPASAENRTWEQFILRNTTGRFIFEHRYRLEQRWIKTNLSNRYMDRVRYCLRMTIPLSRKTLEKNTLFLSFYDEIFINLTAAPFDRNRAYAAIGFQLSPQASVQAGYMAQTLGVYTKQFLQIALFYNPDLRKKK